MHRFSIALMATCLAMLLLGCNSKDPQEKGKSPDSDNNSAVTTDPENPTGTVKQPGKMEPVIGKMEGGMKIVKKAYGKTAEGEAVDQYICVNKNGLELSLITYGATVTSIKTPDKDGNFENITHSCADLAAYEAHGSYFGCSVGRFCNRIAGGKFTIDGKEYTLATNDGNNHLHGGEKGFNRKVWTAEEIKTDKEVGVKFSLVSPDGDEGYPGELKVTVDYYLTNDDELVVEFSATTNAPTHVNLTNHNYWNLTGDQSTKILDHQLKIAADKYLEVNSEYIPTGELKDVKGTPFDFTDFHAIGERVDQLSTDPLGYDHCYVLSETEGMHNAATVKDPESGRMMEITTTEPAIQFYSGNFLDGTEGSGGFAQHTAFCLETQHYPDAPNQPEFPSTLLRPGQTYSHKTVHKFSVVK